MRIQKLIILLLLLSTLPVFSQKTGNVVPEKGKLTESVQCTSNPRYTYALYLPASYNEAVNWPVIFVFDPSARGKTAVNGFIKAASKYGYIVAGSNNSKNQMAPEELSASVNSMFSDVQSKFSIDLKRIYTAGFSGGARVASMIALQSNAITGVIACGAGLPGDPGRDKIPSFAFYGLVGTHDMNYLEISDLGNLLYDKGVQSHIRIFDGTHDWPSPDLLLEAVEWMKVVAINKGLESGKPDFLRSVFLKQKQQADNSLRNGMLIESVRNYQYLLRDFAWQPEKIKIQATLDSLTRSPGFIIAVNRQEKDRKWEQETQNELASILLTRVREENLPDSVLNRWVKETDKLRNIEKNGDPANKAMASRIVMLASTLCYETGRNMGNSGKPSVALISFRLGALIDPGNKEMQYQLSKSFAINGKNEEALNTLEQAVKLGYNNRQGIENDPAFAKIKQLKRFTEITSRIK